MKISFTLFGWLLGILSYGQHRWLVKDINSNNSVNQLSDGTYIGSRSSMMNSSKAMAQGKMYKVVQYCK